MARLPSKAQLSGPASLRSGQMISSADMSGIGQGVSALGGALSQIGADRSREQQTVDLARAEAFKTEQFLAAQNEFEQDGDYSTFSKRAPERTKEIVNKAASLIRDPSMRERWSIGAGEDAARVNDSIFDRGMGLRRQAETNALDEALETYRRIYVDPATPEEAKQKARADIEGAISVAGDIGLLTPDQADARKKTFVDGADVNRAMLEAETNPGSFLAAPPPGFGNPDLPAGMRNNNPGNIKFVGQGPAKGVIGPSRNTDQGDPQAVFATPEDGMREAYRLAMSKYNGGKTTANDLIAGEGGWTPGNAKAAANIAASMGLSPSDDLNLSDPASAQKFLRALVKQEHGAASDAYPDSMIASAVTGGSAKDFPIVTKGASVTGRSFDPDLKGISPDAISRFKQLQNTIGRSIPVVSGFRDAARNERAGGARSSQHTKGGALDLDVSDMSQEERVALIKQARASGFSGIGVYANSIHIDTGPSRAWGPSHKSDSLPAWAREAVNAPVGNVAGQSAAPASVPAYFANLSPEDQFRVRKAAEAEQNRRNVDTRAQIEVTTANAPTAIMNTGRYDNPLPTMEQFFAAYGPTDGAQRFNSFQAEVQTSQQAFDMRTMSANDIEDMVGEARPTSSGDNAALQQSRYETLSKAAEATIKARNADPAAYASQAFPSVRQAWEGAGTPEGYQAAIAASVAAQMQLGVSEIQPLPKGFVGGAVEKFQDVTLPEAERMNSVGSIIMATQDPAQRKAIFQQMVEAGLPDVAEGAFEAMARGDQGAARRLFQAAAIDPSKLPGNIPETPAVINEAIQAELMDEGQLGDIFYGLRDGTVENMEKAQRDSKLLTNAVSLRLRNGEALDAAITGAAKDLYGNVQAVTGDGRVNAQILVPADVDPEPILDGLAMLRDEVRAALTANAIPNDAPTETGMRAVVDAATAAHTENILSEGYFRNSGAGYVFIDPYNGTAIEDASGQPIIFTPAQVSEAVPERDMRAPEAPLTDDDFTRFQQRMQQ